MKSLYYPIFIFILGTTQVLAQSARKASFDIRAGFSIGAATPIGIPQSIRKIESYNPGLLLSLEAGTGYRISPKFGLATAVRFEQKGMTTKSRVKGYYTTFNEGSRGGSQSVTGYFTGRVETRVKNSYLTLPVHLTFHPNNRLTLKGGGFASMLIEKNFTGSATDGYIRNQTPVGEREDIEQASYNFSQSVRKFSAGAELAADYKLNSHLFISANVSYAITPLMKRDFESVSFELHNVFVNLGIGYRLF